MKSYTKFILIGLFFGAFPGEIANQLIVHKTLSGFVSTMAIYIILLAIGYFISKLFVRRVFPTVLYFVIFGVIGLLVEYLILGQGPEAFAIGMFTFWAFLFTLPRIFIGDFDQFSDIKRKFLKYLLISGSVVLLIFLIPGDIGPYLGVLALMVQLMGFYIFFLLYLIRLHRITKTIDL